LASERVCSGNSQSLAVLLDEEDALNCRRGVRVDDIVGGGKVLDEKRKDGKELLLGEL
jgi:hypothetical protein